MNRIKELRQQKKLSLAKLSDQLKKNYNLNISAPSLMRYENGTTEPKLVTWQKLADFFNVSIGFLQGTSDVKKPFDTNTMDEWWNKTINYMSGVDHKVFDAEKKANEQDKNSKQLAIILDILSKNESLPDHDVNYNNLINGEKKRSNIYKAISSLAEIGRSSSTEAETDIQKITDLLENLERKTELPPELGGYDINKKTSDD